MFFISIYLLSFSSAAPQSGPFSLLISNNSHGAAALEVARANKLNPFWPRLFAIDYAGKAGDQCFATCECV
ncbi:hypothetical protein CJF30_00003719 [Rutstroemia sp. NJR-2017a BBW]|nr:hypothetical protein CJF30_00003719 [Rutstroemia sp. NJR-2017a BBW]